MCQDYVGSERIEDSVKPLKRAAGYAAGALPSAHEIEIEIGNDVEQCEYLIEHLSVLCGHTHAWFVTRIHLQRVNQWCHLDRLWPRSRYAEHFLHGLFRLDHLPAPGPVPLMLVYTFSKGHAIKVTARPF